MYTIYFLYFPCKFYLQLILYFAIKYHTKWIDISQHELTFFNTPIPITYIDIILPQFFTANFLPPGRCFLKTIKCILYPLLLIENYSQVIFYNLRQSSIRFNKIRFVYCIHQDYSPQNVSSCMNLSKYVEVCRSL